MKANTAFALALACAALPLAAAVHEFKPSDKIEIRSEPKGFESLVVVSQAADRVVFDCRAAFAKGMANLVCDLPVFEDPALAGEDILMEVFASSGGGSGSVQPYLQMWKEVDGVRRFHALKSRTPFTTTTSASFLNCLPAAE